MTLNPIAELARQTKVGTGTVTLRLTRYLEEWVDSHPAPYLVATKRNHWSTVIQTLKGQTMNCRSVSHSWGLMLPWIALLAALTHELSVASDTIRSFQMMS